MRPQSSNRNKLQLNTKMVSGGTERTSTSGNERVANENERSNHGSLMILHGGGGMMGGNHIKSAGGLNTAKNHDHKIKFSAVSLVSNGANLDSQRSGIHFNQQNVKFDMKNNSQNLQMLQNLNNFNGTSLETSMNNRLPGTAINTSTAFPSTPNLQSARGSVNNVGGQDHGGNTINSSNSSLHTFTNLIGQHHKGGNAVATHGGTSGGTSQSYRGPLSGTTQQQAHHLQVPHQLSASLQHHSQGNISGLSSQQSSSRGQKPSLLVHTTGGTQPMMSHHHSQQQVPHSSNQSNLKTSMKISVNQNNRKKQSQQTKVHQPAEHRQISGADAHMMQQQHHQPGVGGRPQRTVNVRMEGREE